MAAQDLPPLWRARAAELAPYAPSAATAFETAAAELEAKLRSEEEALLPPDDASAESGLSTRRLAQLRAGGQLPNHGTAARPLYRRGDLPRRVAKVPQAYDVAADAARLLGRRPHA